MHALEIGADDYLVKPFSMKSFSPRHGCRAPRHARQDPRRGDEIVIEELRLDTKNVQAYVDGASAERLRLFRHAAQRAHRILQGGGDTATSSWASAPTRPSAN